MKKLLYILITIVTLFGVKVYNAQSYSEQNILDSLHKELSKENIDDTTYINLLAETGEQTPVFRVTYWDTIVWLSERALETNPSTPVKRSILNSLARSINNIGYIHQSHGDIPKALEYYHKSLKIEKRNGNKEGIRTSLNNIGYVYSSQGDILKALEYYHESMKISEEIGNKEGVAISLNNIGAIYDNQGDISKALEYYHKSLKIDQQVGNKYGVATSLNNIGYVYGSQGNISKALEYYRRSLKIDEEIGNKYGIATSLNNIGDVYIYQGDVSKALEYYHKSLKIDEEIGNKEGIVVSLSNIGEIYFEEGNNKKAKKYAQKSLVLGQDLGFPEDIKSASSLLSKIYESQNKGMSALEMYKLYITMKDSIFNEENDKTVARQQAKYEYEKKAAADSITNTEAKKVADALLTVEQAQNKQHKIEAKQQKQQAYFLYGGLGLALFFGGFIFNRFRITNKQKSIIEEQKGQVDKAFDELEEKNTEIMDSINYAKRIQSAILPSNKVVKEYLQNSFILYKPKDIVAGDFYWLEHKDGKVLFAAADCTGHGVPGAMVSVICNNGLNRSVREHGLTDPGEILNKTREIVIQEFEKSEEEVNDGMDIALCALEFLVPGSSLKETENEEQGTAALLQYAGAHNPLWIIRNGEIIETKANKQPIGKFDNPQPYTTHTFKLQKNDTIYIFSDGYADQFGGDKGKKFKAKAFKELLLSIQNKEMEEQKDIINDAFETWKGELEQIDDVCVIGVRV